MEEGQSEHLPVPFDQRIFIRSLLLATVKPQKDSRIWAEDLASCGRVGAHLRTDGGVTGGSRGKLPGAMVRRSPRSGSLDHCFSRSHSAQSDTGPKHH